MTIWLATGNIHKKNELDAILKDQGIACNLLMPQDAGLQFDPEETGDTFIENALLKAKALHSLLHNASHDPRQTLWHPGDPIIADDSGLCVDALDGRPGIYSARYGGPELQDHERNALLLEELGSNPQRRACFVCAMALLLSP